MHIMQTCGVSLLGLVAPAVFFAQPMTTPIVDPPRQEMQTVAPNLLVGPYLMNVTGKTFVSDVFLDVAVTHNGQPGPDGKRGTFDTLPMTTGDSTPDGGTPVHLTGGTPPGHAKFVAAIAPPAGWTHTA